MNIAVEGITSIVDRLTDETAEYAELNIEALDRFLNEPLPELDEAGHGNYQ